MALKPFRQGFLSFARFHDLQGHFGPKLPIRRNGERLVAGFLDEGWSELRIERRDACNHFSELARQAFENLFEERGLQPYALSGTQIAWWPPFGVAPTTKVAFRWGDTAGLGQIQGVSLKRQMNWHFDVSVAARSAPVLHVRIISRLVVTEDGRKPFDDPAKMHRLRRSFAKAPPGAIRQREPGDGHGRIRLRCGSTACTAESRCRFVHRPCRRRSEGERNYDASQPSQDS